MAVGASTAGTTATAGAAGAAGAGKTGPCGDPDGEIPSSSGASMREAELCLASHPSIRWGDGGCGGGCGGGGGGGGGGGDTTRAEPGRELGRAPPRPLLPRLGSAARGGDARVACASARASSAPAWSSTGRASGWHASSRSARTAQPRSSRWGEWSAR